MRVIFDPHGLLDVISTNRQCENQSYVQMNKVGIHFISMSINQARTS